MSEAPYSSQDLHEITTLVNGLGSTNKAKKGFRAKKTSYKVHDSPTGIVVDSWRFQEWDYKRRDLPTYARGLFTTKNSQNHPEIAIRGYDKFFNIDEVPETKWDNILTRTKGPYELTLKENGCIIFLSGLEDDTLLVCSKHSTGARDDVGLSHSMAGEQWINKQLSAVGKTRADLARELRKRNATAVAELCDDDFEEHILAYGPDKAGLYLHGLNINLGEFMTYPGDLVQQFADDWGFRKVGLQVFDDIEKVKEFLEGVAESGAHEGRDVEGFVIRCKRAVDGERSVYADWFFKYKFEEPYLMYRQWRECTKALISGKPPRYKKHAKITEEYLLYARKRLAQDPHLGKLYNQNHGIIKLREDFLAFKNLKGSDAANMESEFGDDGSNVTSSVVIVPIATIGCGKTTVAVALTHLFGWGLVQNDNITGKNRPTQMVKQVMQLLASGHPVVISDRNNSERREREQIIKDVKFQSKDARLVAMNFAHGDIEEVRRITRERVLARGNNHQTIQAATETSKVIGIMENFIQRFQPCDPENHPDDGFDLVINLDATNSSRANVETMVNELHRKYPKLIPEVPSVDALDEAVKAAIENYSPDLRHTIPDRKPKSSQPQQQQPNQQQGKVQKKKPLEYMSVSVPASSVNAALEEAFKGADAETSKFYKQLQQTRRIQPTFHVTLMHRASSKEHPEKWAEYVKLEGECGLDGRIAECDVELERVVFDDRIMSIVVRILDPKWTTTNRVAHVTVGTRDQQVKPKESNDLLAKWLELGPTDGNLHERAFESKPVVKGVVRGVLAR
ncbi:RNA ligase-domain-containing protein [Xylariales sp. PMI_506]|nr:RNA ligase-domain-containing protein [Xylariales sp. PMI_506]